MRITIVDPSIDFIAGDGLRFGNRLGKENIGAHYLVSFLISEGHAVSFVRTKRQDVDGVVTQILSHKPEIVAMGPYTYNFSFAVEIANTLKTRTHGNLLIVFGNVHAAMAPETVPEKSCDYIIIGEAELAFRQLLHEIENGSRPDRLIHGGPISEKALDSLPFPYRDEQLLQKTPIFFHPPGLRNPKVALVIGSRGCIAHCDYCVTPQLFGRAVSRRSPSNIVAELDAIQDQYGEDTVFHFADPLFNAYKPFPRKVAEAMIQSSRQYWCTAMCDFHGWDQELIRLLKRAGFYWLMFGIETFNDAERSNHGKRRGDVDAVLQMCFEEGILIRGFIMLGSPGTTYEILEYQKQALWQKPLIGNPRMNFCVPFPGTLLYKEMEKTGSLITRNWESFTTEEPIIRCSVKPSELLDFRAETSQAYYQSEKYREAVAWQARKFPELEEVYADAFALMGLPIKW